jgi:hypothetical protein
VITGASWTTAGRFGSALVFNGTSGLVNINDSPSLRLTTGMTLEAWVNPSVVNSAWRDVIYKGNDNYYLEATSPNGGRPAAAGTIGKTYGTTALAPNTWTHLAVTYDGATIRLYVNAGQVSSLTSTATIPTSTNPLQIGGDSIYGQFFQGVIDEVRVYNRALSQTEIQTDMNTAIGESTAPATPVAFNFALGNGGNMSVTQGQSVTNTVTATLSSGSSQAVSFSTSGLPAGATASYTTSTSCNPTCSRTLNITTSASGGGVTKTTNFSLTVNSPTVATVATPTITPNGGSFTGPVSVTLQTVTSEASIYYTTNGSTPTQSSTPYTGAMTLMSSATVKAIAFKSGSNPSAVASASFTVVAPSTQLTLTWQDNSTNENNFGVERKTGTSETYAQIALVSANTTSYVDTSVTRGVTYCYRVDALNSAGASAYTNEVCAAAP